MREIEFRGKSTRANEWVYGQLIIGYNFNFIITSEDYDCVCASLDTLVCQCHPIEKKSNTIGQYTGLKDKNGTKIFEGDIVLIDEDERQLATICWDNECANFYIQYDNLYCTFDDYYGKDLEVVGNIYDNPELLEQDK